MENFAEPSSVVIRRRTAMKLALLLLVAAGIAVVMLTPVRDHLTVADARAVIAQLRSIWYGPILFVATFALASILFVPASIFIIPAGLVWGWKLGALYSLVGASLGAIATFAIGKYVGGGFLRRFGERGEQIARKLDHAGFKTLLILRLIPLWPFPVYNYAAGLADVRYRDFIASTLIGLCPAILVMNYSADALVNGTLSGPEAFRRLLTIGLLIALVLLVPGLFRKKAAHTLHMD